ncbi:hypothetical protein AQUCO_00400058v1 [Aquilegia coerulea]|uniref:F-box domain-containing protein n=1 Tax=Aquilegia coerulea TaxID=218851 RepID=A0A2G5ET45_AQUCA|nr:hypothetical protein AQUCO_00400058v1 [Aquilegia coerulea]
MRKKKIKSLDVEVPPELWEQILAYLPIKSIARSRCVSKSWFKMLTDLKFLEMNFELVKKQSKIDLETMVCDGDDLYSLKIDPYGGNHRVIEIDHSFDIMEPHTRIVGSCEGLICVAQIDIGDVYVWNPHTHQFKHRRDFSYPNEPHEQCDWSYLFYGFGYNATKRDFLLVKIFSTNDAEYQSHVYVHALRRNSWRKIEYFRMPYVVTVDGGALVNDSLHWPAYHFTDSNESVNLLIAYNIYKGKGFKEVKLPDLESENWHIRSVGVLNGLLTVLFGDKNDTTKLELWIMLDYGRKESWRNLFKITTSIRLGWLSMHPLYFMNNGAEILLSHREGFYFYDSKDQDEPLKKYVIHNLPTGIYQSIKYFDSDISTR